jgi:polycystin 1L2
VYASFLWLLYLVTYSNAGSQSYNYQKSLQKQFVRPGVNYDDCLVDETYCSSADFGDIISVANFWKWAKQTYAFGLRAETWYNGYPPWYLAGFFNDKTSRIIGYATLRQIRVKKGKTFL